VDSKSRCVISSAFFNKREGILGVEVYTISNSYIKHLRTISKGVLINTKPGESIRKYVGVIFNINNFDYFVPLSSPKDNDYFINKKNKKILRGSVTPIYRIVEIFNNKRNFLVKLKFSSMIPVPKSELTKLDLTTLDTAYANLINSQIRHIRKNFNLIQTNHAIKLYEEKCNGQCTKNYLKNTVDFKALESGLAQYIEIKNIVKEVAIEEKEALQPN